MKFVLKFAELKKWQLFHPQMGHTKFGDNLRTCESVLCRWKINLSLHAYFQPRIPVEVTHMNEVGPSCRCHYMWSRTKERYECPIIKFIVYFFHFHHALVSKINQTVIIVPQSILLYVPSIFKFQYSWKWPRNHMRIYRLVKIFWFVFIRLTNYSCW